MINDHNLPSIALSIKKIAKEMGFQDCGISDTELTDAENFLFQWLKNKFHGEMDYMQKHGSKRSRPNDLIPDTCRVISVRMDYFPPHAKEAWSVINDNTAAFISRYALGRDYHKVLRNRLQKLAKKIEELVGPYQYRVFVDSAPVMEKAIAEKAGLGWIGKHSNLLSRDAGSWFFLGEIYVDIPLPSDETSSFHCGDCTSCIDACPTNAIIAPFQVDARRCISYLTIEHKGPIPVEFRQAMGNRIYGCDDCQLVCPWNRFSEDTAETDFSVRHQLDDVTLLELFNWDETTFLANTEGSAIRRIGYERWQRNIIVALGNSTSSAEIIAALTLKLSNSNDYLAEHIEWSLAQLKNSATFQHP